MKGYSECSIFSERELEIFEVATKLVAYVKEEGDDEIRCHELARAVGVVLNLEVEDGRYGYVDHSWLWTMPKVTAHMYSDSGMPNILDVYCVGRLPMVALTHSHTALPHCGLGYRPGEKRTDIKEGVVQALVTQMMRAHFEITQ